MRSRWLAGPAALFALSLTTACAVEETPADWDNAPLSDYDDLVKNTPDNDSLPNEMKADYVYPALSTELLDYQSPVKSQGKRGVCSIFSTAALMEHLYIKAGYDALDFSEQYLQWATKFKEGSFPHSSGSNAGVNLRTISTYGIPLEEAWPYDTYQWDEDDDAECVKEQACTKHSDCASEYCDDDECAMPTRCYTNGETAPQEAIDAKKYKLPVGRYLSTKSVKNHIHFDKTGVVMGLDFFYQAWNHRKSDLPTTSANWNKGYVLFPNEEDIEESHKKRAGHSVLLVGWDDELEVESRDKDGNVVLDEEGNAVKQKGFYIFKNSWGTSGFGIDNTYGPGYGYIAIEYVEKYGRGARVSALPDPPDAPVVEKKEISFSGAVMMGEEAYHTVQLGSTAKEIKVEMVGDNDADLYTRFGEKPTDETFDCRPYIAGSGETCEHEEASAETLELRVYGWEEGFSNYQITVTWSE